MKYDGLVILCGDACRLLILLAASILSLVPFRLVLCCPIIFEDAADI